MLPKIFCPECWPEIRPGVGFFVDPPYDFFQIARAPEVLPGECPWPEVLPLPRISLDFLCFFVDIHQQQISEISEFYPPKIFFQISCFFFRRPPPGFFAQNVGLKFGQVLAFS